jgi:hypothetical protein
MKETSMIDARKDGTPGSTIDGQQAAHFEAAPGPHEKPRGVFSFVTWSFALAQVFAFVEFLGGMSRSATANEEQSARSAPEIHPASAIDAALTEPRQILDGQGGETAAVEDTVAHSNLIEPNATGAFSQPRDDEVGANGNAADNKRAGGAEDTDGSGGSGESGDTDPQIRPDAGSAESNSAGLMTIVPGSSTPPSLLNLSDVSVIQNDVSDIQLVPVSGPSIEAFNGVFGTAPPIIQTDPPVLAPAADAATDLAGDLIAPPTVAATDLAGEVLALVTDAKTNLAGDVFAPLTETATDLAGDVLAPVTNAATDLAGEVLAPVTDAKTNLAGDVFAPLTETATDLAGDVLAPVANAATDLAGEVLAPVTDATTDLAGDVLAPLTETATNVAGDVLAPVTNAATDLAGDVLAPLTEAATNLAGDVLAPVTDATTNLAGDGTANAILDYATSSIPAATPNEQPPGSASASAPAEVVTDALNNDASATSAAGGLGSGGTIEFHNNPTGASQSTPIQTGGRDTAPTQGADVGTTQDQTSSDNGGESALPSVATDVVADSTSQLDDVGANDHIM